MPFPRRVVGQAYEMIEPGGSLKRLAPIQPRDDTKSEAWLYSYSKGNSPFNPARWETPLDAQAVD